MSVTGDAPAVTGMLIENLRPSKGGRRVSEVNIGARELKSIETSIVKLKTKVREALFALSELAQWSARPHICECFCCPRNAVARDNIFVGIRRTLTAQTLLKK